MKNKQILISLVFILSLTVNVLSQNIEYKPKCESLEKANPVPEWFMDAKFGIYFHWGVYSVPAYANEWYPRNMYIKGSAENLHHIKTYGEVTDWPYNYFISGAEDLKGNYVKFAPKLKDEGGKFDPDEWAQLFADAGAKFAGPVAEHHDGFSMWVSLLIQIDVIENSLEVSLAGTRGFQNWTTTTKSFNLTEGEHVL